MEKKLNKTISVVLPITYEIKQIRQQYPFYKYLIFALEFIIFLSFPLSFSMNNSDKTLKQIINIYQLTIINNRIFIYAISGFFLLFIVIFLLALITVNIKLAIQSASNHDEIREKAKRFYLAVFVAFQITIMPAFIVSGQNIANSTLPQIKSISFIIFILTLILINYEDQRRLYQFSLIIILFFRLLTSSFLTNLIIAVFSVRRGRAERKQLHKKIVYYQIGFWAFLILIVTTYEWQINYFYLIISLVIIGGLTILNSLDQVLTPIQQNQKLMKLTYKIIEDKELSVQSKLFISKCICSLKQDILEAQDVNNNGKQQQLLAVLQHKFTKQQMVNLLSLKIDNELKRQYSHLLKIQRLQTQIRFNKFSMKTLYNIEKLIQDIKLQSTFQEKQKLYDIVNLTQKKFLNKQNELNAKTVINVQKYTEEFYQSIINISIIMQQFWTLHKHHRLNDQIISTIISKVTQMEHSAEQNLSKIDKFNNITQELVIFDYLKRMTDSSSQLTKKEYRKKDRFFIKSNINYIIIEQGNIIEISNQLLNQFQLTKQQGQGYRLSDIVYEPISQYLIDRLDKIIQEQTYREDVNVILPLKISREQIYIQPYNSNIKILPELINGIKYIINLEKTQALQKPMILYQSKNDKIVGASKSLKKFFNIENDQYLFKQLCNNIDILKLLENNLDEVVCEIKLRRKGNKLLSNKLFAISVVLKKVMIYEIKNNSLVLLEIAKKDYFEIDEIVYQSNPTFSNIKSILSNNQQGKNQKIQCMVNYCKIPNPYEHLIQQKISKMNQFYRMSYLKATVILIVILLLAVIASLAILNNNLSSVGDQVKAYYTNGIVLNSKEVNTYSLFRQSAILYSLKRYPGHFQSIFPYNMSSLIEDYSSRVSVQIKTILSEDINEVESKKGFSYDIIEDAKYSIATNNITALLNNWNRVKLSQPISFSQIFSKLNVFLEQFQYLTTAALTVLLVLFWLILYLIQYVFGQILYIYEQIDHSCAHQFVEDYRLFTHELYESKHFKGVKSNKYLKKFKFKKNLANIDEVGTFSYLQTVVGFDMQANQILMTSNGSNAKINRKSIITILGKQAYICLILVFFGIFLYLLSYYIRNYQSDLAQIADHSALLHRGRSDVNFNSALFLITSLQQVLPPNQRQIYKLPSQLSLSIQFQSLLPSFFSNYTSTQNVMTNMNLCNLYLNSNQTLFRTIKCGQILDGILTVSLSQAMVSYNKIVSQYLNRNMSQLQDIVRKGAKYPVYMQILYSGKAFLNLITTIQKIFTILAKVYINISNKIIGFFIKLGWILLPLYLILFWSFYNKQSSKCQILMKLFFILPKSFLLQMKITKILKQKDILSSIQRLSF